MKKSFKFLSVFLSLILTLCLFAPAYAKAAGLSDIQNNWAKSYINQGVQDGWLSGYPDGTFRPNKSVTRGAFCKMLNNALKLEATATISFKDVKSSDTFYTEIRKAVYAGYISGYSDGTFRAGNPITHQQAAAMVSRVITASSQSKKLSTLKDNASIANYARAGVQKVLSKGYLVVNSAGQFRPKASQTRAETAKIICSMVNGERIIHSSTTVSTSGKTFSNAIYTNLITVGSAASGKTTFSNCAILGSLTVRSGGTVLLKNTKTAVLTINGGGKTTVSTSGTASVVHTYLSAGAVLTESGLTSGNGFTAVGLNGSALKTQSVTLRGNFTAITASSPVKCALTTGSISNLGIMKAAAGSSFALSSGTKVAAVTINGSAAFTGTGVISSAVQNTSGVTYETAPVKISGSAVSTPMVPTITPANGASNISITPSIKLTFQEALYDTDKKALTAAKAAYALELREGSVDGDSVIYSATVSTDRKTITITPASALSYSSTYYVILKASQLQNQAGALNKKQTFSFTTGANSNAAISISSDTTGVSTNTPSITLKFKETPYLLGSLSNIKLHRADSTTSIPCTVWFDDGNCTATVIANQTLDSGTRYCIGIPAGTFQNISGESMGAASLYFTTAGSSVSAGVNITSVDVSATSATINFRSTTNGSAIVSLSGQVSRSVSVSANGIASVTFDNLDPNSSYNAAVVVIPSGQTSSVSDAQTVTTKSPGVSLTNLLVSASTATIRVTCDVPGTVKLTCSPSATISIPQIQFENAGSMDVKLTGLTNNTDYTLAAALSYSGGSSNTTASFTTSSSGNGSLSSFQIQIPNNPVILYSNPQQTVTCHSITVARGASITFAAVPASSSSSVKLSPSSTTVTGSMTRLTVTATVDTGTGSSSTYTFYIPLNVSN